MWWSFLCAVDCVCWETTLPVYTRRLHVSHPAMRFVRRHRCVSDRKYRFVFARRFALLPRKKIIRHLYTDKKKTSDNFDHKSLFSSLIEYANVFSYSSTVTNKRASGRIFVCNCEIHLLSKAAHPVDNVWLKLRNSVLQLCALHAWRSTYTYTFHKMQRSSSYVPRLRIYIVCV